MCEYCKCTDERNGFVFGDVFSTNKIDVGIVPTMRIVANIAGDPGDVKLFIQTSMRHIYSDIEINTTSRPIHYCPMCGRKL